jgi:phosphoribosyl 1,2-cyclic phosphodiesterase
MRFASLGSGSRGNALVVESGRTRVLLDCGFSYAETVMRLARFGLAPEDIDAVLVTHEHDDHVGGVGRFAARTGIPVYLTAGTLSQVERKLATVRCECFDPHSSFSLGALHVRPFPVPHNAREPAQFVFDDGTGTLGVLTDVGAPTAHIREMLSGCAALVLECNHDTEMLRDGPYPPSLKSRIGSRFGHLNNADAASLLAAIDTSRLRHIVAAHLSESNNTPELARNALAQSLGTLPSDVLVASQDAGFDWLGV